MEKCRSPSNTKSNRGRQRFHSIVVVVVMVVPTLIVEPTLAIVRPVTVTPMSTVDDNIVVVTVMVAVDMDVAATPVEIAAVVLRRRGGGSQDQDRQGQTKTLHSHDASPKFDSVRMALST